MGAEQDSGDNIGLCYDRGSGKGPARGWRGATMGPPRGRREIICIFHLFFCPGSLNLISRTRGVSQQVGDVLKCGMFFALNLHAEMGTTIAQSIRFKHLVFCCNFGELFCQLFGPNTFLKTHPKPPSYHHMRFSMPQTYFCGEPA